MGYQVLFVPFTRRLSQGFNKLCVHLHKGKQVANSRAQIGLSKSVQDL